MKRLTLFLIALFITFASFGQQAQTEVDFRADFTKALDNSFTDKQLDKVFSHYRELLTPHSDATRLAAGLEGHELSFFFTDRLNVIGEVF